MNHRKKSRRGQTTLKDIEGGTHLTGGYVECVHQTWVLEVGSKRMCVSGTWGTTSSGSIVFRHGEEPYRESKGWKGLMNLSLYPISNWKSRKKPDGGQYFRP